MGPRVEVSIALELEWPFFMKQILSLVAAASCLSIAGCSPASDTASPAPSEQLSVTPPVQTPLVSASRDTVTLDGFDDLIIGEPVPPQSRWEVRGEPASNGCTTARSAAYPGVYAIIEDNKVRRITFGEGSKAEVAEGISVGAAEARVTARFSSFREEPHKYEAAPAKYIGTADVKPGATGWRFEIGSTGTVSQMHVGQMPVLAYVEGCG